MRPRGMEGASSAERDAAFSGLAPFPGVRDAAGVMFSGKTPAMLLVLTLGGLGIPAPANAAPSPSPSPQASPSATPYPMGSIVDEADKTVAELAKIQGELDGDTVSSQLHRFVPKLNGDIALRTEETARVLREGARIGKLQNLITDWIVMRDDVALRLRLLNDKMAELDAAAARLGALSAQWTGTRTVAVTEGAPPEILSRITGVIQQVIAVQKSVAKKRLELLTIQGGLADQSALISQQLAAVEQARGAAMSGLLVRDSPPLWQWRSLANEEKQGLVRHPTPTMEWQNLREYLVAERGLLALCGVIWVGLVAVFRLVRRKTGAAALADPGSAKPPAIFDVPVATATLLTLCLGFELFADALPWFHALLGIALLGPLVFVFHRILDRPLRPLIWVLAAFYLATLVREALAGYPLLARGVHLAEALGGVIFALWLLRASRFAEPGHGSRMLHKIVIVGARLGLGFFVAAFAANTLGYVNLAYYVGAVALESAFVAILLYAVCHVVDGLVGFGLTSRPLSVLALVRRNRAVLERRLRRIVNALAVGLWVVYVLEKLSLLSPLLTSLDSILFAPLFGGAVTLGGILTFLLTVWASFVISRFIRFVLEEDIYERIQLKPGLPFAISTILHYAILLLGFYLATAALIGDINKFTIFAGAFGVGIGFGLQTIVNNFVSGLIVLFERPVKIGDYVQIGTATGVVQQIGIRATVVRTDDGSEILIPNAQLMANPVTNWTLTDQHRRLEVDVTTVSGVEPQRVMNLLEQAAASHRAICKSPAPRAVLAKFTPDACFFELRVWTLEIRNMEHLKSDLTLAVREMLAKNGIAPGK